MAEAVGLSEAINFARHVPGGAGRPALNSDWMSGTVAWHLADDGREPCDRIRDILRLAAQFMRRAKPREPMLWAYVQEVSAGKARHWHFAMYVPAALQADFKRRFREWVAAGVAGTVSRKAVAMRPVFDMVGWKQYLLKDGSDDVRAAFSIPARWPRTGGDVTGPRVAVSRTINAQARHKAGWMGAGGKVAETAPRQALPANDHEIAA